MGGGERSFTRVFHDGGEDWRRSLGLEGRERK